MTRDWKLSLRLAASAERLSNDSSAYRDQDEHHWRALAQTWRKVAAAELRGQDATHLYPGQGRAN